MRGVAAGQHLAVQQQGLARLPGRDFLARQRVEVDAPRGRRRRPVHVRPVVERSAARARRRRCRRARSARGAWRRNSGIMRHRLGRRVRRVIVDLHVEHGGQAAQPLRADAERVDLVVELDAQFFDRGSRARAASARACRSAPSALPWPAASPSRRVPPMPMPSMPGGHQPAPIVGTVFNTQSTIESDGLA